ncbi:flavoprotein [Luedemannella helvata]|uniref:Flavoprotein n=1 Tax=Luedemannella helvata TaxID=349315 RepID=A0ABP4X5I4_9ACTN
MSVLYAIVTGSPVAARVGVLVEAAQAAGWRVCVVASPDARKFLDVPAVAALTGFPVRSTFKNPGEPDLLPPADAIIVAPATANTVAKWAVGIADTLPLGLIIEGQGKGLPVVAVPFTNDAMAAHPAFRQAVATLRGWGVTVLFGDDVIPLSPPGAGEDPTDRFPWKLALEALPPPAAAG